MNLAQLRIATRDMLSAGKQADNAVTGEDFFWSDSIINYYLNNAQRTLWKVVRRAKQDYFARVMRSTDSAVVIAGRSYNPSSLKITAGVGSYDLPPDFMRMILMTSIGQDPIQRFRFSNLSKEEFKIIYNDQYLSTVGSYLCDIIGLRSLILRPIPQVDIPVEIVYEKILPNLKDYSVGTVEVADGSANMTFVGTQLTRFASVGNEIIFGLTASNINPGSVITPSEQYGTIKTITDDTHAILDAPKYGAVAALTEFIISPVSDIPIPYHDLLVLLAVKEGLLKKGRVNDSDSMKMLNDEIATRMADMIGDLETRQGQDIETSQAYLEDYY